MNSSIENLLVSETAMDPDCAKMIAPYFESYAAPEKQPELEVLKRKSKPGQTAVIICQKPRNLLFNWRECLLKIGVNLGAAAVSFNPLAYIGFALKAVADLWEGTKIQFGTNHAKVVEALWIKNLEDNPVAINDILTHVSKDINRDQLERLLQDLSTLHVISQEQGKIRKHDRLILQ